MTNNTMPEHDSTPLPWAIITPVYEDGESFAQWCRDIAAAGLPFTPHIVVVDDGSTQASPQLAQLRSAGLAGRILRLRRNVGSQIAIAVGLAQLAQDAQSSAWGGAVVIDCDGEDVPAQIPQLSAALTAENADFAVAARQIRSEGPLFRLFYWLYKLGFRLLTGHVISFGNFMACSPRGLDRIANMQESWIHMASAIIKSKLRRVAVPLDRNPRYTGRSHMSFIHLVLHGIRAVAVFGDAVLTRMAFVCACSALASILIFTAAIMLKLTGMATPGWLTIVTGFAVMVFLQTGALTLITLLMGGGIDFRSPQQLRASADALVATIEYSADGQRIAEDAS